LNDSSTNDCTDYELTFFPQYCYLIYSSYINGLYGISSTINESNNTKIQKSTFRSGNSELHEKSTLRFLKTKYTDCYKISNTLPKILFMLIILYFSKKDMRFAVLLSIIFLLMIEKQNSRDLNNNIIKLLVNDSKQNEELNKLNKM
jgi:hypothetical protein